MNPILDTYIELLKMSVKFWKNVFNNLFGKKPTPRKPDKLDPPPPPPVDNPPEENPPNRIKPPPIIIFRDPPNNQPPPPPPPTRILPPVLPPSGTSTNTEVDIRSVVKKSLLDHTFGCILARPFYSAEETLCEYENTTFSELYDIIKADIEAEQNTIEGEINDGKTGFALRTAPAFLSLDPVSQPVIISGTKQIHKIASYYTKRANFVENFEVTGLISVGATMIEDCSTVTEFYDEPRLSYDDAECMIPLSIYDEMEGYKSDQLQIIWRNVGWGKIKKRKCFTIPYPKAIEDYTADGLKGIFPPVFTFGRTVIDIRIKSKVPPEEGIRPIHKCIIMTNHQTLNDIDKFIEEEFKTWLKEVSPKSEVKDYVTKFLDKSDIWVGDCFPYRAVLMGWDKEKKYWFNKADWILR